MNRARRRRSDRLAHLLIDTGYRIRGLLFPQQVLVDLWRRACALVRPSQSFGGLGGGRLTTGIHTALDGSYSNSASPSSRRHRALWVSKCTRGSSSNAAACSSAGAPGAARGIALGAITDIKVWSRGACLARLGAADNTGIGSPMMVRRTATLRPLTTCSPVDLRGCCTA
jgi:hypothetical protein